MSGKSHGISKWSISGNPELFTLIFRTVHFLLQIAKNIDRQLHSLCGRRVMPVGLGDEDVVDSRHGGNKLYVVI